MNLITKMKMGRMALALALVTIAGLTGTAAAASKDEDAIQARATEFAEAFSKGDAKAAAAFWAEDATLVNPVGVTGKGPAEIEKVIASDLATIVKDTKSVMKVAMFRPVGKDAAWVDLEQTVTGMKAPDGKPMPPMTFHVPALMVKKGKTWMIAEARPYMFLPPPPKAPAAPATK